MIKYPLYFKASASSKAGICSPWLSSSGALNPIQCAIPLEFQGPGTGYSPEDLLTIAVINCFVATFKVFAEKTSLSYGTIEAEGHLEINRDSSGKVGVTKLGITIIVQNPSDIEKTKLLLNEAKKNCLMANALKIPCEFDMRTA